MGQRKWKRLLAAASGLLLWAAAGASAAVQEPQQPTFGVETQLVLVDVRVTKDGVPVPGLRQEDFTVLEDGVEQPIVHLEEVWAPGVVPPAATPEYVVLPRLLVFVMDELHMRPNQAEEAKRALLAFLDSGAREGDRVVVVSTATGGMAGTQLPDGRASLDAFIRGLKGRYERHRIFENLSEAEALRIVKGDLGTKSAVAQRLIKDGTVFAPRRGGDMQRRAEREAQRLALRVNAETEERSRAALAVVARALEWSSRWRGRKAFALMSGGFVYDPALPEFYAIARIAQRANGTVSFLDAHRLGEPRGGAEQGAADPLSSLAQGQIDVFAQSQGAEVIASESGGFIVRHTNDLRAGLERVADDVSAYYLIGYEPPGSSPGEKELRRIEVKVAVPGVEVRHRKGY
jgi:VWFA-related protein